MVNNKNINDEQWKLLVLLLKNIAEDKGITHQQIADETGLLKSNVTRVFAVRYRPNLEVFLKIAQAVKVNFFFEDKESKTDLNLMFEKAMDQIGRRTDSLPKN